MMKRALISVFDKTGLDRFAADLVEVCGEALEEILSSGGTAAYLRKVGPEVEKRVVDISDYTGVPESPEGLLKTLTHRVHGGILLHDPNNPDYVAWMKENDVKPIDMVVVNLYPFTKEATSEKVGGKWPDNREELLQHGVNYIDIGGPTMLRAAAKASLKHGTITVVTDPKDYDVVIKELREDGEVSLETKRKLTLKVFNLTAEYDNAIRNFLPNKILDLGGI